MNWCGIQKIIFLCTLHSQPFMSVFQPFNKGNLIEHWLTIFQMCIVSVLSHSKCVDIATRRRMWICSKQICAATGACYWTLIKSSARKKQTFHLDLSNIKPKINSYGLAKVDNSDSKLYFKCVVSVLSHSKCVHSSHLTLQLGDACEYVQNRFVLPLAHVTEPWSNLRRAKNKLSTCILVTSSQRLIAMDWPKLTILTANYKNIPDIPTLPILPGVSWKFIQSPGHPIFIKFSRFFRIFGKYRKKS
jgi:hypothetical protein